MKSLIVLVMIFCFVLISCTQEQPNKSEKLPEVTIEEKPIFAKGISSVLDSIVVQLDPPVEYQEYKTAYTFQLFFDIKDDTCTVQITYDNYYKSENFIGCTYYNEHFVGVYNRSENSCIEDIVDTNQLDTEIPKNHGIFSEKTGYGYAICYNGKWVYSIISRGNETFDFILEDN